MDLKEKINKGLTNIKKNNTKRKKKSSKNNIDFLNNDVAKIKSEPVKEKKSYSLDFKGVEKTLLEARKNYKINIINNENEKSISILFEDIRLIALNEIFKYLQNPKMKFAMFKYKKECHELMTYVLDQHKEQLPNFNNNPVKITYFRQSTRFIDHDSFIASFKFFLDGIVSFGILPDDNPNFIDDIKHYQVKKKKEESNIIGIRIEELNIPFNKEKYNPYLEWGFFGNTNHSINNLKNLKAVRENCEFNDFQVSDNVEHLKTSIKNFEELNNTDINEDF